MTASKKEVRGSDRALATRNHIIQSYLKLMQHRVWNRISVKDLCIEASVTRGTFYQYFDSIVDLMENIEASVIADLQKIMTRANQTFKPQKVLYTADFDRDYDNEPSIYSVAWFRYCRENPLKMRSLLNPEYSDSLFISRIRQILSQYLSNSMHYEGLPDDAYRYQYLTLYTSMHLNGVFSWIGDGYEDVLTPEDMAMVVDSVRTGGLYTARRNRMSDSFQIKLAGFRERNIP